MLLSIATILFIVSIPLALITANLNAVLFDAGYYEQGQSRHAVGQTTEFTLDDLRPVNRAIVRFFRTPTVSLPDALAVEGADRAIFNEREVHHMEDVRGLVQLSRTVQIVSLAWIAAFIVGGVVLVGRPHVGMVVSATLWGSGLTLVLVAVVGIMAATDFSSTWQRFHLVSFSNDLWLLDPQRDNLIRIFPFYFWYDAVVGIVVRIVLAAIVLGIVSAGALVGVTRRWARA